MSVKPVNDRQRLAPTMIWVTLFAGISGFVYQFMADGTLLTFMVSTAALGGLVGASKSFDERDRQLLWQSYAKAFEYLFLVLFLAYSLTTLAGFLHLGGEAIGFVNGHWISMLVSAMCIILGSVGLRNFQDER
jgi:hypothetical protein